MKTRAQRRPTALLFALVPGWGHVYWGREFHGLAIFTVFSFVAFGFINGLFVYQGAGRLAICWLFGLLTVAAGVASWVDLYLRTAPSRIAEDEKRRHELLQLGTKAYLRNHFEEACEHFRACVRLHPQDVDALFRLGVLWARRGDERQARRWFRRTLRYDLDDKWRWEIEREIGRFGARARAKSKPKAASSGGKERKEEEETERASV